MSDPRLLLLDEPSLGLAPIVVDQMFDAIRLLHKEGMTLLLVEQNLIVALELATRGYVIETGRVRLEGEAAALGRDPGIRAAYLGL
jgi:branched-chain amino acid transport system ATP-binding protein